MTIINSATAATAFSFYRVYAGTHIPPKWDYTLHVLQQEKYLTNQEKFTLTGKE